MALKLDGKVIKSVLIVDDDDGARRGYGFAIKELGISPIYELPKLRALDSLIGDLSPATAVFSDFRLRPGNYAKYDGDTLVAECYKHKIPAILCTTYFGVDEEIDRTLVRYIPVLLKSPSPDPDEIVRGFRTCISEHRGEISEQRKAWRSLVRVNDIDKERGMVYVVIPGWNVGKKIPLKLSNIPDAIAQTLKPGKRFHAMANLGAETYDGIYFYDWEPT